ncbi:hypothetical protein [Leifsonia aquatica]|uniref:hypothetical protein n=1 Tax=Leifsonia aquatica TaxID=144185 RepID=UPI00046804DB|nr:hypothetical protein [Leifsonia aquatica]
MVSSRALCSALIAAAVALVLAGCATGQAASSTTSSRAGSPTSAPSTAPASPTRTPSATGSPSAAEPPAAAPDAAVGRAAAVRACESIAPGFSASNVAAALPSAAEAARNDAIWQDLATDLAFIHDNPIDPATGEGPQKTVDDASAVAQECFSRAGVQVSQD